MISWQAASVNSPFTIGLFFVEKSNHMLRLVFDTRLANCSFLAPPATRLPAEASSSRAAAPAGVTGCKVRRPMPLQTLR